MDLKFNNLRDAISQYQLEKNTIPGILRLIIQDSSKQDLVSYLDSYIEEKEIEISQICTENSEDLLSSLSLVTKMTDSFKKSREDVSYVQSGIQEIGNFLLESFTKIEEPKKSLVNLKQSLDYIEEVHYAVTLLSRAQNQILGLRHISALRTLTKVKSLKSLREVNTESNRIILATIPAMEKQVEDKVEESLSDWLVKTRKKAESLGKQLFVDAENKLALEKQKKTQEVQKNYKIRESHIMGIKTMQSIRPSVKPSRELNSYMITKMASIRQSKIFNKVENPDLSVVSVDFSVLFQFENVFEALGKAKEFREKFKYSRRAQILQTMTYYDHPRDKLESLAGQLLIEKELVDHDDRLRSEEELQSIWIETVTQLERSVQELIISSPSASTILSIKKSVVLFVQSALKSNFTHRSYELFQLLEKNHKSYREALMNNFKLEAVKIIDSENYSFIRIAEVNNSVLQEIGLAFDINGECFPFSKSVPDLAHLVKRFVWMDLEYLENLFERSGKELFKTIDELMQTVNKILFAQINEATVLQSAILAINTNYLYKSFSFIDGLFENYTGASREFSAREGFIELKDKCENAIFTKMQESISTYIRLLKDFTPDRVEPHHWLKSMLDYINNTAASLESLLGMQMCSTALFASFQYFAKEVLSALRKTESKFTVLFINCIEKDLSQITLFMQESIHCRKVPGLMDALADLREFVNLFVNNEIELLKDPNARDKKFSRIDLKFIVPILEKFKETKGKEPKQKAVLAVAKKLKEIV